MIFFSIFWAIFGHKPLRVHRWDVLESISIKKNHYFVISKSSLNQDQVETSHRRRQHIMNKRAEMMFYFVITKSSLNQDEVETSHRRRQQIMNKRAEMKSSISSILLLLFGYDILFFFLFLGRFLVTNHSGYINWTC